MLRPIPKKALKDTVEHAPLVHEGRSKTYPVSETLSSVLIQTKKMRQFTDGNLLTVSDAQLFFDVVNSVGDPTFKIGDRITFTDGFGNSQVKYIKNIVEGKVTDGDIHHYEVMLL